MDQIVSKSAAGSLCASEKVRRSDRVTACDAEYRPSVDIGYCRMVGDLGWCSASTPLASKVLRRILIRRDRRLVAFECRNRPGFRLAGGLPPLSVCVGSKCSRDTAKRLLRVSVCKGKRMSSRQLMGAAKLHAVTSNLMLGQDAGIDETEDHFLLEQVVPHFPVSHVPNR